MKDKIKEILDEMKFMQEKKVKFYTLDIYQSKLLLDYITNLQEELEEEKRIEQESLKTIQELEEKLYNLTHTIFTGRNYNEVLKSEQDYKSRNEKAIEILHNINDTLPLDLILNEVEHSEYVLQGEDKDE